MAQRKDAVANRARLIEAGFEILAERDADLTVRELALQTGLGIGTAYRHFPTHDDLIRALYDQGVETLAAALQPRRDDQSAWDSLVSVLETAVFAIADSPGLRTAMRRMYDIDSSYRPADSYADMLNSYIQAAQDEGTLREGIVGRDIGHMSFSLGSMVGKPNEEEVIMMRRQLSIFLDGLRADSTNTPLPASSMDGAQFHAFLHRSNAPVAE